MNESKAAIIVATIVEKIQVAAGIVILFLFGICTIMAFTDSKLASGGGLVIFIAFDLLGIALIFLGRKRHRLIRDFRQYVTILSNDPTGSIPNLAAVTGTPVEKVRENLEQMIAKRYFPNAVIDQGLDCVVFPGRVSGQNGASVSGMEEAGAAAGSGQEEGNTVAITCKCCGGVTVLVKGQSGECEYCGAPIKS